MKVITVTAESKPDSFPEKPSLEIGIYYDTMELDPTEEEAAEYLEQLAFEEEESKFFVFFFRGMTSEIGMFSVL